MLKSICFGAVLVFFAAAAWTAVNPVAEAPMLRRVDSGLYPGAALMYYYTHADGVPEGDSAVEWELRSADGTWRKLPSSGRYITLEPGAASTALRAAVVPVSRRGERGRRAAALPLEMLPVPVPNELNSATIFCDGSVWALERGVRKLAVQVAVPAKVQPLRFGRLTVYAPGSAAVELSPGAVFETECRLRYDRSGADVHRLSKAFFARLKNFSGSGDVVADLERGKFDFVRNMKKLASRRGFTSTLRQQPGEVAGMRSGRFLLIDFESQARGEFDFGRPGWIQWFPVNNINTRFVSTMSLTFYLNALAAEFKLRPDVEIAALWGALLADQSRYSFEQWKWVSARPDVAKWFGGAKLYWENNFSAALRFEHFGAMTSAFLLADAEKFASGLSAADFAVISDRMIELALPFMMPRATVTNQEGRNVVALLKAAQVFCDFSASDVCRQAAGRKLKDYFWHTQMPDGTDTEQTVSYWFYGPAGLLLACGRLSGGGGGRDVLTLLAPKAADRLLALLSMAKPNGQFINLQSTGEGDFKGIIAELLHYYPNRTAQGIFDSIHRTKSGFVPGFTSVALPYGGFFVGRNRWGRDGLWFALKTSRYGEGHYDESFNHFSLNIYGQNVVDSAGGTAYFKHPTNTYFVGSSGKNTVTVDGFSQLIASGKGKAPAVYADPVPGRTLITPELDAVEGLYDGAYGVLEGEGKANRKVKVTDARHLRTVLFLKKAGVWIIVDRVTGKNAHSWQQHWNFHPDYRDKVKLSGTTLLTCAGNRPNIALSCFGTGGIKSRLVTGQLNPEPLGWYKFKSRRIAIDKALIPAPHVEFAVNGKSAVLVTVIAAFPEGKPAALPLKSTGDNGRLALSGPGFQFEAASDRLELRFDGGRWVDDNTAASGLYLHNRLEAPFARIVSSGWQRTADGGFEPKYCRGGKL